MRILYVGDLGAGQLSLTRCLALEAIGADVRRYDFHHYVERLRTNLLLRVIKKFARAPLMRGLNRGLLRAFDAARPDVVYVDKGVDIERRTLQSMRRRGEASGRPVVFVHFHPDSAFHPWLLTRAFEASLLEYDAHMCPHSWVLDEYRRRGVGRALFIPYGFDPQAHFREVRFSDVPDSQRRDVVFVGRWEEKRSEWFELLARSGVRVHVWGPRWQGHTVDAGPIYEGEYADFAVQRQIFGSARITLGLLSITHTGGHTTRTFEVPACGGFMLTDRTPGQAQYFKEGREMACFDSPEELCEKVLYYLRHDDEREAIREAGHQRCVSSGYDYEGRMRDVLNEIERVRAEVLGQSRQTSASNVATPASV